ncbi:MAG: DNA polymerase III subunit delta' [Piscirickettsiaceae bacterium]|nr:MAG: DNA polymerase III subunit delta' [Piscirickettsiaceae bacterium]
MYYPWLESCWHSLNRYQQQQALPNALLLVGEKGFGYEQLVNVFANSIYCTQLTADGFACGKCSPCQMFIAGSYPDFSIIKPEEGDATIKIAAIRKLIESLTLSRQYNRQRIIIITSVDEMLHQASNSLLKTLEEPNDGTSLILIAHKLANVPATIKSRCQIIPTRSLSKETMLEWLVSQGCDQPLAYLNLANGSPIFAHQYWGKNILTIRNEIFELFLSVVNNKTDPLVFSERCFKLKELPLSSWMISWLTDAIILSYDESCETITNIDLLTNLKVLIKKLHLKKLFSLFDQAIEISQFESGQINQQLLFDDFAISCIAKD